MLQCIKHVVPNNVGRCFIEMLRAFGQAIRSVGGRHGGLMVSVLDSGLSGPGSGPGRGHCVVFLGKTLDSHGASPPRCINGYR